MMATSRRHGDHLDNCSASVAPLLFTNPFASECSPDSPSSSSSSFSSSSSSFANETPIQGLGLFFPEDETQKQASLFGDQDSDYQYSAAIPSYLHPDNDNASDTAVAMTRRRTMMYLSEQVYPVYQEPLSPTSLRFNQDQDCETREAAVWDQMAEQLELELVKPRVAGPSWQDRRPSLPFRRTSTSAASALSSSETASAYSFADTDRDNGHRLSVVFAMDNLPHPDM